MGEAGTPREGQVIYGSTEQPNLDVEIDVNSTTLRELVDVERNLALYEAYQEYSTRPIEEHSLKPIKI